MSDTNDDVILEPESEDGLGTDDQKLKKLRKERDEARKERDEYLTGWQRSKADYVNLQKRMRESGESASQAGIMGLGSSIVSVFDSLEAAQNSAQGASEGVRVGIEQVTKQLESALKEHGIVRYTPSVGEQFDPEMHEPMQTLETSDENEDNTVAEVCQSGYTYKDMVIRPARVIVKRFSN